jgi:hypothetical protein
MVVAVGISRGAVIARAERKVHTTTSGVEPVAAGATRTAGEGSRTTQQSGRAVLLLCAARAQQLCAVCCVRCRQIPNGASIVPIKTMATAARWKKPLRMTAVYHGSRFSA